MSIRMWKEKPPGPEQIELERMFKCNEIDSQASPDMVKKKNDIFKDFSASVFANHFRKIKAKLGLCASVSGANGSSSIREVTGLNGFFSDNDSDEITSQERFAGREPDQNIAHVNPPCWTWVYTDHEKKKDFVCVAIPGMVGKNATVVISEDGTQLKIKYEWPSVMFKPNVLFDKSMRNGRKLSLSHPKVHAFASHLLNSGVTENSTLPSERNIVLPRKIQQEMDSWTMEKVIVDDTKMLLLEFSTFQNILIINDAKPSLDF